MDAKRAKSAILLGAILAIVSLGLKECSATDNRIVGGRPAEEGEFPYQVSLRRTYNDKHFCGGSLITENHVLTAAHCMYYRWGGLLPPIVVSVVAGQLNLTMEADSEFRNISQIVVHPKYNKTSMENDVAIIKLSKAFPLSHLISPIKMAEKDDHHLECVVSGWGVQQFESTEVSESLLTTLVKRITNEKCDGMYGNGTIFPSMLCAHDEAGEHDACQGDSGGPLVSAGLLVGVISTGEGCASKEYPGIYASVPYLYDWINETVYQTNRTFCTTEVTANFTEEVFTEPVTEVSTSPAPEINKTHHHNATGHHHATNSTHITTPKLLQDNSTSPIKNGTNAPLNIGDHSRIPEDTDTSKGSSYAYNKMSVILLVFVQMFL